MAAIEFIGFVNDVRQTDGEVWLLKTAETHRREGADGNWETTGRTFRDVRAIADSGIDLSDFKVDDIISVEGYEVTIPSKSGDTTYYNLTVWAHTIEKVESEKKPAAKPEAKRAANRRR